MSFERLTVVGHVGQTRIQKSSSGTPYARIGVAVNRGVGERRSTVWYSVLLFGRLAENPERIQQLYTPGRLVLVEGRPQVELFNQKDGTQAIDNTIVATGYPELLDRRPESS